jgi:hypothetical protein
LTKIAAGGKGERLSIDQVGGGTKFNLLTKTAMSIPEPYLPPEILDSIVDLLHDDPKTLKNCCLASKSWVPRTRMHLFARIVFKCPAHLKSWKESFPDPENSPAHHTRSLIVNVRNPRVVTTVDANEGGWVLTFSNVERLELRGRISDSALDLVPFHNFSPVLKSLCLVFRSISLSKVINLICSLPLLEDLNLKIGEVDITDGDSTALRPSTSPPLTGTLTLSLQTGLDRITRRLLDLPNGLHFRALLCKLLPYGGELQWATALVEGCSDALEYVRVGCFAPGELSFFGFAIGLTIPIKLKRPT